MKHILICDDDPVFAQLLSEQVKQFFSGNCEISLYQSAGAVRSTAATLRPDIALLDIELESENGIALARELFPADCGTSVIFITGHVEYCTDVYEAEHIYFLLKPVQTGQLSRALTKALTITPAPVTFSLRIGGTLRRIELDRVQYIESFYRKLRVHTTGESIEAYGSISSLPQAVLRQTIHCHKSFLVNPKYIRSMDSGHFTLINGTLIPISHSNCAESRRQFLHYLARGKEAQ